MRNKKETKKLLWIYVQEMKAPKYYIDIYREKMLLLDKNK